MNLEHKLNSQLQVHLVDFLCLRLACPKAEEYWLYFLSSLTGAASLTRGPKLALQPPPVPLLTYTSRSRKAVGGGFHAAGDPQSTVRVLDLESSGICG